MGPLGTAHPLHLHGHRSAGIPAPLQTPSGRPSNKDPKLFCLDPDPTCHVITDLDSTFKVILDPDPYRIL